MRPIWGVGLLLDRNLIVMVCLANLAFALAFAMLSFRRRPVVDRIFIVIGLFVTLNVVSLAGMHLFARTPVQDAQFFVVD
jgi:hypothetical protein